MMEIPDNLEELFNSATVVKSGKVREVRRAGDIFIKVDRRNDHSFGREFECAAKLQDAGIPVTEALFYGKSGFGNFLATKAFDGVPLEEFIRENTPGKEFFIRLTTLVRKMLAAGFIHRDFHLGNLLYSPEKNELVLVDVDSITKIPPFLVKFIPQKIKYHILTEFRAVMGDEELLELFASSGVNTPETFLRKTLMRNAAYIRHHWQRRREQIFAGYPKFTRKDENGVIFDRYAAEKDIESGKCINDPQGKIFLAHFYLDQIRIPHRRALKFDPQKQVTTLAAASSIDADGKRTAQMVERVKFYGIKTDAGQWKQYGTALPALHDLNPVAELPFLTEGK